MHRQRIVRDKNRAVSLAHGAMGHLLAILRTAVVAILTFIDKSGRVDPMHSPVPLFILVDVSSSMGSMPLVDSRRRQLTAAMVVFGDALRAWDHERELMPALSIGGRELRKLWNSLPAGADASTLVAGYTGGASEGIDCGNVVGAIACRPAASVGDHADPIDNATYLNTHFVNDGGSHCETMTIPIDGAAVDVSASSGSRIVQGCRPARPAAAVGGDQSCLPLASRRVSPRRCVPVGVSHDCRHSISAGHGWCHGTGMSQSTIHLPPSPTSARRPLQPWGRRRSLTAQKSWETPLR